MRQRNLRRKLFGFLLAFALVIGMLPVSGAVYADQEPAATEWTSTNSLPADSGNYKLMGNVTLTHGWTLSGDDITLDLNGKNITYTGLSQYSSAIWVSNESSLNITGSGTITYSGNDSAEKSLCGVRIDGESDFLIDGCTISNFNACVFIDNGSFTMESGTICDNAMYGVGNRGTFYMNGGTISGNAEDGVRNFGGGVFFMDDGLITGNEDGVDMWDQGITSSFVMSGGEISGNTNGVYVSDNFFEVAGNPVIFNNTGVNVYTNSPIQIEELSDAHIGVTIGTLNRYGYFTRRITDNNTANAVSQYFESDDSSYQIAVNSYSHQLCLDPLSTIPTGFKVVNGGSYSGNCKLVYDGETYEFVAFELAMGRLIGSYENGTAEAIDLSPKYGIFVYDSTDETGAAVFNFTEPQPVEYSSSIHYPLPIETGSYKLMEDVTLDGPWFIDGTEIKLDLNGYTVTYEKPEVDQEDGWAVDVANGGTLTLTGEGTITNSISFTEDEGQSTGLAVRDGGTLNIDGCTIENFTKGVLVSTVESDDGGHCNLISGEIKDNEFGVFVWRGSFTMTGGVIEGNGTNGLCNFETADLQAGTIRYNGEGNIFTADDATTTTADELVVTEATAAPTLTDAQKPTAIQKFNYDGASHALVAAPSAALPQGYTMNYTLGKNSTDVPSGNWSTAIPTGTEAGTYYVWAMAIGGYTQARTEPFCLISAIVPPVVTSDKVNTTTLEGGASGGGGSSSGSLSIKVYTSEATKVSTLKPAVKSHELITDNGIGIRFYVDLSMLSDEQKSAVVVNFEGGATTQVGFSSVSNVKDSLGNYGFTCLVNSTQIGNDITASIYYGGSEPVVDTYRVTDYTEKFQNKTGSEIAGSGASQATVAQVEKVVTLVKAVSDFGTALNAIKDVSATNISSATAQTSISTEKVQQAESALANRTPVKPASDPGIAKITYTLTLGPKTSINFYVEALGQNVINPANITVTKDSANVTVTKGTDARGRIKVTVGNIDAADLDDLYTITVSNGTNTYSVGVSALTYANYILTHYGETSQAAKQAAAAIYLYNQAAEAMDN